MGWGRGVGTGGARALGFTQGQAAATEPASRCPGRCAALRRGAAHRGGDHRARKVGGLHAGDARRPALYEAAAPGAAGAHGAGAGVAGVGHDDGGVETAPAVDAGVAVAEGHRATGHRGARASRARSAAGRSDRVLVSLVCGWTDIRVRTTHAPSTRSRACACAQRTHTRAHAGGQPDTPAAADRSPAGAGNDGKGRVDCVAKVDAAERCIEGTHDAAGRPRRLGLRAQWRMGRRGAGKGRGSWCARGHCSQQQCRPRVVRGRTAVRGASGIGPAQPRRTVFML